MIVIAGLDGAVLAGYERDHPDGRSGSGADLRGPPYPDDLAPGSTADYIRIGSSRASNGWRRCAA